MAAAKDRPDAVEPDERPGGFRPAFFGADNGAPVKFDDTVTAIRGLTRPFPA